MTRMMLPSMYQWVLAKSLTSLCGQKSHCKCVCRMIVGAPISEDRPLGGEAC